MNQDAKRLHHLLAMACECLGRCDPGNVMHHACGYAREALRYENTLNGIIESVRLPCCGRYDGDVRGKVLDLLRLELMRMNGTDGMDDDLAYRSSAWLCITRIIEACNQESR